MQQFPVLCADAAPLCSQAGRGPEHGEAEASGGPEHPETQPQGAGSAQPAGYVSRLVMPSPEQAHATSLAEVPDPAGSRARSRAGGGTCGSVQGSLLLCGKEQPMG